ncbi:unnamed protein product [Polarella glacialis]|uniref:Uncharacterized protein n=2 Tax=Polarella glacialis TaxID=89957 RepID=A0A813JNB9_POLGL|nr:unnamed protein product [Polarella glacialis]
MMSTLRLTTAAALATGCSAFVAPASPSLRSPAAAVDEVALRLQPQPQGAAGAAGASGATAGAVAALGLTAVVALRESREGRSQRAVARRNERGELERGVAGSNKPGSAVVCRQGRTTTPIGLGGGVGSPQNYGLGQEQLIPGLCWPLSSNGEKWDPLDLSSTDAKLERYTAAEIKHGRIAMIAVIGYILPEMFRFPGCEGYESGLGALTSLPIEGWGQLVAFISAHELLIKPRQGGMGLSDFGQGTELLEGIDDAELHRKQTAERNNGRLAMVAIMGLLVQDYLFPGNPIANMKTTGWWGPSVDYFVHDIAVCQIAGCALPRERRDAGLTAMRATASANVGASSTKPVTEMSVAVPFLAYPKVLRGWVGGEKGFDPLGVTDALPVYLVREAELKHGRICMLATVGWIATDLGMRFPGEKFAAIANSVNAHDQCVQAGYMTPFLGAIGTFELYSLWLIFEGWEGKAQRDAGDYFLGKKFLPADPEKNASMRMKEIENGRLAMFAFSGIVTQAVVTGKTWPFM